MAGQQVEAVFVPLTEQQLRAIGLVCHQWSVAETVLEHLIWALVPTDQETGRILTTHVQNLGRIDMARTLVGRRLDEAESEKIDEALGWFDELRQSRNQVVHNSWAGEAASDLAVGLKPSARGVLKISASYWSAPDIAALAAEIESWTVEMINFMTGHLGWPPPRR